MRYDQLPSLGFPVGRIAGIVIRIHFVLVGFWLFELNSLLKWEISRSSVLVLWLLDIGLIFGAILLHELGHALTARRVGGRAHEIVLWPLGGLAYCEAPNLPLPQFLVAAGGPAVTLAIALVSWVAFELIGEPTSSELAFSTVYLGRVLLVDFQLYLFVLNVVPAYPLDGGRMFQAALWGWFARKGQTGAYGRASLITVYVSRVTLVLLGIYCVVEGAWLLLVFIAWGWMENQQLYVRIREGADSDGFLGYDFSRGYTSLEGAQPRVEDSHGKRSGFFARLRERRRERARRAAEISAEDRQRVDELLQKIQREGMPSLTREERKFLERVSKGF